MAVENNSVRRAEVMPRGSTRWLLLHLVREVRDPCWSSPVAARRLLDWAGADLDLLQSARARLIVLGPAGGRASRTHERALESLDLAIDDLSLAAAA